MKYRLSKESHKTFVGDVFSLRLLPLADGEKMPSTTFLFEGDGLHLRTFKTDDEFSVPNGALITVLKEGTHTVFCEADGEKHTFTVQAHALRHASSEEANNYYLGDMHTHTTMIHDTKKFAERTTDFQEGYVEEIRKENLIDFGVISDHAETINDRDFFRAFTAVEEAAPMRTTIFPGTESEVIYNRENRFGIPVRKSGEILTLNANGYILANGFSEFIDTFKSSPAPIVIFAHPQVIGWGEPPAMWDFDFPNLPKEVQKMACGIEVLDGSGVNLYFEQSYSFALDAGLRVSPYADGDVHQNWIENRVPYRTVVMATENSREALLDAIRSGRAYATESGKVKLRYTVNGKAAPADLSPATEYRFHIELDTFDGDAAALPVSLRVCSDYGKTVYSENFEGKTALDFTVCSETARYFYLRLTDKNGKRTFSSPVYTGRAFDDFASLPSLSPLDMKDMTATDLKTGLDASISINGDPYATYFSEDTTASILIDMKDCKKISALGHYPTRILRSADCKGEALERKAAGIVAEWEIHTSLDGKTFTKAADGYCRVFGDENIYRFAPTEARYLRFDVLSTVGAYSGNDDYKDEKASIGNLAIFE